MDVKCLAQDNKSSSDQNFFQNTIGFLSLTNEEIQTWKTQNVNVSLFFFFSFVFNENW